jgi:mRNA-degrading endonuclease RelE of RelBE toxin-antitoxin system
VLAALDRLAAGDSSIDVLRLTGSDQLRLRVGDWRVLFRRRSHARQIVVEHVLPRRRAYDR